MKSTETTQACTEEDLAISVLHEQLKYVLSLRAAFIGSHLALLLNSHQLMEKAAPSNAIIILSTISSLEYSINKGLLDINIEISNTISSFVFMPACFLLIIKANNYYGCAASH